jgi:hypothetical protein
MTQNDIPNGDNVPSTLVLTSKETKTTNKSPNGILKEHETQEITELPNGETELPPVNPVTQSKEAQIMRPGSANDIKNIYKSPKDKDGEWTWVDKYPEDVAESAENEATAKFAIIVRNIKSKDSRKNLEAHSIIVQSPWLKDALGEHILKDYPGITCGLSRLEFEAPFKPFIHRWANLLKFMKKTDEDETAKAHVALLHRFLKEEVGDKVQAYQDYIFKGVITFEHLWMIFQPGGLVISDFKGSLAAYELDRAEYMENNCGKFLRLRCEFIDWSGKQFGRATEIIDLPQFLGTTDIQTLTAFPLRFHKDKEAIKAQLVERGKKFESLAGSHFRA